MSSKRIVISTFGSFGDVHPYIAIALELKARGHRPLIATSEVYREKIGAAGIEFYTVRPDVPSYDESEELAKLVERLMSAKEGPEAVGDLIIPHLRDIYSDLDAATKGADLLLTHPLPFAGTMIAEKKKLPWISSVLAPASFLSVYDPIVPPQWPWLYHLMKLSPWVGRGVMALASIKLEKMAQPIYNLRQELGLARGGQPLFEGQHSPTKVLALFSKLLAKPQPDWPEGTIVTGFPFYDRRDYFGETETPAGLIEFLNAGAPPIVFTLGSSAIWVARDFYRDSIAAAQALGRRALLLIGFPRNMPSEPLPDGVAAFEYAPYSEVLPRACAIVHQGGVGTTGQAMRSGKPVLILPHAHDQFDNAARIERLGCGRVLARPRYNAKSAIRELRQLLDNPRYAEAAAKVGAAVREEDGARVAADEIEKVLSVSE
ncbi:MAG TPA: nucleotide disphospho-sugar-binding domain-containing protein [Pyrinomonadaceae bacterium]|nr:nucleotide disphospho-sugar-binding domain-containing protein [Pyrinomonadaceae bacterium]